MVVFRNTKGWGVVFARRPLSGSLCHGSWGPAAHVDVNLVTALVPSDTACLASSPGKMSRTAVWISRLVTVGCRCTERSCQQNCRRKRGYVMHALR